MKDDPVLSIRNSAIASCIGGVSVACILGSVKYLPTGLLFLKKTVFSIWLLLQSTYSVPLWLFLILITCTSVLFYSAIIKTRSFAFEPRIKSYISDEIYDVNWRWKWRGNEIVNLWCYCPKCDGTLIYDDNNCDHAFCDRQTKFICENCDRETISTIKGGNKRYTLNMIKREIRRKIRTQIKEHKF